MSYALPYIGPVVHSVYNNAKQLKENNEHPIVRIVCLSHTRMPFGASLALT